MGSAVGILTLGREEKETLWGRGRSEVTVSMEASADRVESFRDGMTLECCPELGERSGALPLWKGAAGCGLPWAGCRALAEAVPQDVGMLTLLPFEKHQICLQRTLEK